MNTEQTKRHSEEWLTDSRDFWWNSDFLVLMSKRWNLASVKTVLDVGCGHGHWGQRLFDVLPTDATMAGIDFEPKWIEIAQQRAVRRGVQERCRYQVGGAYQLDYSDDTFDMVTCQTLLIHLADPLKAIREFLRVLKPGGLLAVVEPNNLSANLVHGSIKLFESPELLLKSRYESIGDTLAIVKFFLLCEQGKVACGEGSNSLGDLIPGLFVDAGVTHVQTYTSDCASALLPPYNSPSQRAAVGDLKQARKSKRAAWDRQESLRYFLAGGGTESEFDKLWALLLRRLDETVDAIHNKTYHSAGGGLVYLISGRKPPVVTVVVHH